MSELETQVHELKTKYPVGSVILTQRNQIGVVEWVGILTNGGKSVACIGASVMDKKGKTDGTHNGVQYFKAEENGGLFLDQRNIRKKISPRKLLDQLSQLQRANKELKQQVAVIQEELSNLKRANEKQSANPDEEEGDTDDDIKKFLQR